MRAALNDLRAPTAGRQLRGRTRRAGQLLVAAGSPATDMS